MNSYSTQVPSETDVQEITAVYKFDTIIEIEYSYDLIFPESN